ncbi:hypothetical protein [Phytohabitans aurantiacus]|jgi:hypothetical protein|uniref:DUF4192 domain-containing protein n=1 Tax=Phytohabitans aurantiacus TaxID=3016789 RepID=A0ABQ5R152_9ACTN|nr:hypothetical protein [Phytohabitans aurantiacus]GLI00451.1 hypothetical protein Pa4123_57270 [Phytohabitans aurantiacus]
MMLQEHDAVLAEAVDSHLVRRPVTAEVARAVQERCPEVVDSLERWISAAAAAGDWRRVERFANLGAKLQAPGLDRVIMDLLEANHAGLNQEDLVDILGEIMAVDSASVIFGIVKRSIESDAPAYWLCQKAILALSELESDEASRYLKEMTADSWPNLIRWHAAVALCVEDELGFDED